MCQGRSTVSTGAVAACRASSSATDVLVHRQAHTRLHSTHSPAAAACAAGSRGSWCETAAEYASTDACSLARSRGEGGIRARRLWPRLQPMLLPRQLPHAPFCSEPWSALRAPPTRAGSCPTSGPKSHPLGAEAWRSARCLPCARPPRAAHKTSGGGPGGAPEEDAPLSPTARRGLHPPAEINFRYQS